MRVRNFVLLASGMGVACAASAGNLTAASGDITVSGGATAGYFYNTKTGSNNMDGFDVPDVGINLSSDAKARGIGFNIAMGRSQLPSVLNATPTSVVGGALQSAPEGFNIFVADFSYMPMEKLTIDMGKLPTNIGYEIAPTYANPNVLLGATWFNQPITYPGARAAYNFGMGSVYAEVNKDVFTVNNVAVGDGAAVVGVMATVKDINITASYYNGFNSRNIIDLIASTTMGNITIAANVDLHSWDSNLKPAGLDDSATSAAIYVVPKMGKMSLPVRVEYIKDGTSGFYGMDTGYTFTVTPTLSLSDNAFVRAEVAYVSSKNATSSIPNKDGTNGKTRVAGNLTFGVKF